MGSRLKVRHFPWRSQLRRELFQKLYIRNKKRFEYDDNGKRRHYTPDFYIKDKNAYLEVKGYETDLDRTKWKQFIPQLFVFKKKEINLIRKNEKIEWNLLNKILLES